MPIFMKSLNRISRCQASYRTEKLKAEGICACHHAFVLNISKNPGRTQEELSQELCLNKSTVARTLNHLEKYGYISRKPSPHDKRCFHVFPTEKMQELLPEIRKIAQEWNDNISEDISDEELDLFYSVLQRMENKAVNITQELSK